MFNVNVFLRDLGPTLFTLQTDLCQSRCSDRTFCEFFRAQSIRNFENLVRFCSWIDKTIKKLYEDGNKFKSNFFLNFYFESKNMSQYDEPFTAIIFYGRQTLRVIERHATYNWITLLGRFFPYSISIYEL